MLQNFKNKICTIFTTKINFDFTKEVIHEYYTGLIVNIDDKGLFLKRINNNCITFFNMNHVVAIAEEEVELKEKSEEVSIKNSSDSEFVNVDELLRLTKRT